MEHPNSQVQRRKPSFWDWVDIPDRFSFWDWVEIGVIVSPWILVVGMTGALSLGALRPAPSIALPLGLFSLLGGVAVVSFFRRQRRSVLMFSALLVGALYFGDVGWRDPKFWGIVLIFGPTIAAAHALSRK